MTRPDHDDIRLAKMAYGAASAYLRMLTGTQTRRWEVLSQKEQRALAHCVDNITNAHRTGGGCGVMRHEIDWSDTGPGRAFISEQVEDETFRFLEGVVRLSQEGEERLEKGKVLAQQPHVFRTPSGTGVSPHAQPFPKDLLKSMEKLAESAVWSAGVTPVRHIPENTVPVELVREARGGPDGGTSPDEVWVDLTLATLEPMLSVKAWSALENQVRSNVFRWDTTMPNGMFERKFIGCTYVAQAFHTTRKDKKVPLALAREWAAMLNHLAEIGMMGALCPIGTKQLLNDQIAVYSFVFINQEHDPEDEKRSLKEIMRRFNQRVFGVDRRAVLEGELPDAVHMEGWRWHGGPVQEPKGEAPTPVATNVKEILDGRRLDNIK